MKTPPQLLSAHSILLVSIGLAVGLACAWLLGRGADGGAGGSDGREQIHAQAAGGSGGGAAAGSRADLPGGRRDRGTPVSKKESKDLAQAARAIFREPVKARRIAQFEALIERTRIEQLPDVVSLIRENDLSGNDSGDEWSRLWTSWGERDPQAAMDFFTTHDWSGWNSMATGEAKNRTLAAWAHADAEMARQFVEADKDFANGDRSMVYGLVEGWANADPEAAAAWLFKNRLAMSAEYEKIIAAMRRKEGQEGLEKWFFQLNPAAVPKNDLTAYAQSMPPDKTAAWIEQHRSEAWAKDSEVVVNTARAMAQQDPEAAVQWAIKTGLDDAMHFSVNTWCEKDLGAASAWVDQNATLRDGGLQMASVVMAHLNQKDPAEAREWAQGISDPSLREHIASMLKKAGK
jgi:hypothetical protein